MQPTRSDPPCARAKAGLDKASSTSIKALAVVAGKHAAYRVNVDPGDSILLSALGLPDLGLFGPDLNAHLETPSLVGLGFTGVNPWDRTRAAKPAAGTWRYQYEDVTTASGIPAASLQGVRSWIDAPYHRLPLRDANTRHVGCAASQRQVGATVYSAEVLEMAATWKDTTKQITLHPAPGQTGRRLPGHEDPGHRLPQGSARTPVAIHRAVRHRTHQVDRARLGRGHQPAGQRGHARRHRPPGPEDHLHVRVSGYVQAAKGGKWVQVKTRTWSFTTA